MTTPNAETSERDLSNSGGESEKTRSEKEFQDMRNAVLGEAGKIKSEGEKALRAGQAALDRLAKWEREQTDKELEAHKDDPAEIRRIRAEQRATQAESDLANEKQARAEIEERHKQTETRTLELTRSETARSIASRLSVDAEKLIEVSKYTDGSEAAIESIAKELPKTTARNSTLKPDSNRSLGGNLTDSQIGDAFVKDPYNPENKARYLEMRAKRGY